MKYQYKLVLDWAKRVGDPGSGTFSSLNSLGARLYTGVAGGPSPIETCANAIYGAWKVKAPQKSPLDDRQYYDLISGWTISTVIGLQARGLQVNTVYVPT